MGTNIIDPRNDQTCDADLSHISSQLTKANPLSLRKTNPIEVCEVMKNLKPNKATGYDQIPPKAVQQSAEVLCEPFSILFN